MAGIRAIKRNRREEGEVLMEEDLSSDRGKAMGVLEGPRKASWRKRHPCKA